MRFFFMVLLGVVVMSCQMKQKPLLKDVTTVSISTLIEDASLNVRALEVSIAEESVVFAGADGRFGALSVKDDKGGLAFQIQHDTIIPNFRSMALTAEGIFVMSIGTPALLFQVNMDTDTLRYKEINDKVFYDAMEFWNATEGLAIGDPTDDCISIIITRDGGQNWHKIPCSNLPEVIEGEAAFAASDTNIAIIGDETWVATGGMASRILYSADKGKTWDVFNTPIIQGKPTTGLYSIDFYDPKNGFGIGGDYTRPGDSLNNKIRTRDGGRTWQVVANTNGPGYRSCVQYVPIGEANELVAVGFKGIDYSKDAGESWTHLSDEPFYTIRFLNDSVAYAAGSGRISKLIFK